jgi:hypothetical protein
VQIQEGARSESELNGNRLLPEYTGYIRFDMTMDSYPEVLLDLNDQRRADAFELIRSSWYSVQEISKNNKFQGENVQRRNITETNGLLLLISTTQVLLCTVDCTRHVKALPSETFLETYLGMVEAHD